MKNNRLYIDDALYDSGDFNTIRTNDGREIDYTHWYTGNSEPTFPCKLVYESDLADFRIIYHSIWDSSDN